MFAHKYSHWKSLKPISKHWPLAHLTKEDTIYTKSSWDHVDATQDDKYPVLMKKSSRLPQAVVRKAPSAPCMGWGYHPARCGQGGSSSLTSCSDHSRAQSQTAFTASPAQIPGSRPSCRSASPPQKAAPCLSWMTSCQTRVFHSTALLRCWRADFLPFDLNLPVISQSASSFPSSALIFPSGRQPPQPGALWQGAGGEAWWSDSNYCWSMPPLALELEGWRGPSLPSQADQAWTCSALC